jgi:hypothetical protein
LLLLPHYLSSFASSRTFLSPSSSFRSRLLAHPFTSPSYYRNTPLQLSDKNHEMSKDYGVLIPEAGISLRGLFIIDPSASSISSFLLLLLPSPSSSLTHQANVLVDPPLFLHLVLSSFPRLYGFSHRVCILQLVPSARSPSTTFPSADPSRRPSDSSRPSSSPTSTERSALPIGSSPSYPSLCFPPCPFFSPLSSSLSAVLFWDADAD